MFRRNAMLRRVRDLGYDAQPFDADGALAAEGGEGRFLLHCLAAAAFGTVFTMGLTDGIWYGGEDLSGPCGRFSSGLRPPWRFPTTLYSGQPFFRSAWRALAARTHQYGCADQPGAACCPWA